MPIDPAEHRAHVGSVDGCRMQERSEQSLGPFRPVGTARVTAPTRRTREDERACGRQCRPPRRARRQRRPTQTMDTRTVRDGSGRVEEVARAHGRACRRGGVEYVGFRRRGDHGATGGEDVRNDERGRLSGSRGTENEHRMLRLRVPPSVRVVTEVDAMGAGCIRVDCVAQCCFDVSCACSQIKFLQCDSPRRRRDVGDTCEAESCIRERAGLQNRQKNTCK